MQNLVNRFRNTLAEKETQFRLFHKYQSQLEGWFKAELLCWLDSEQAAGRLADVAREVKVQINGGRKSVDLRFTQVQGLPELVWLELKHWHIGLPERQLLRRSVVF